MKETKKYGDIRIVDTTLRDGEQTAGIVFSNNEKLEIAVLLDAAGVYQIEAGVPAMGGDEKKAIKDIVGAGLKASIICWCRAVTRDIDDAIECGVDAVCVSVPVSDIHIEKKLGKDRKWILDTITRTINYAKSNNLYVSANAEDASRADIDFLIEFARVVKSAGANRIRFCDTVGIFGPFQTYEKITRLLEEGSLPIEIHAHNDFGMATANALAGLRAGAEFVSVTVNGLGERAGNAALEEVVMALKYIEECPVNFDISKLKQLSERVAEASGRPIPPNKPIVGKNIFLHEAGVQAHGVIKDPETYEVFAPQEVGGERQVIIGKHSGKNSLKAKFCEYGIELSNEDAEKILEDVRKEAVSLKRQLFDKELMHIYYRKVKGFDKGERTE